MLISIIIITIMQVVAIHFHQKLYFKIVSKNIDSFLQLLK